MKKQGTCSGEQGENLIDTNRRKILKKAAYTAPKLVVLGLLTRSPNALADRSGGPVGPPGGWPNGPPPGLTP